MVTKGAHKRLTKEYINIQMSPPAYIFARPLESNILEWHYVLKGPPETPYFGGEYHGKLVFPSDYPFKPPSIRMITPNGRFQTDTRLCLSMSDFHPGTWNPSWSVATILNGLLSFMSQEESTTGSITTSQYDKSVLALRSHTFNLSNPTFREIFPELVVLQQVPFHIAFPNAPATESPPPVAQKVPGLMAPGIVQRKLAGTGVAPRYPNMATVPAGVAGATTAAAVGATGVAGAVAGAAAAGAAAGAAVDRAVRRPSFFSMSHWHKWLAFFLVFAYLVIAKTITRATAAGSSSSSASS